MNIGPGPCPSSHPAQVCVWIGHYCLMVYSWSLTDTEKVTMDVSVQSSSQWWMPNLHSISVHPIENHCNHPVVGLVSLQQSACVNTPQGRLKTRSHDFIVDVAQNRSGTHCVRRRSCGWCKRALATVIQFKLCSRRKLLRKKIVFAFHIFYLFLFPAFVIKSSHSLGFIHTIPILASNEVNACHLSLLSQC